MTRNAIRLVLTTPEFFSTPPTKLRVEENAVVNRTYFIKADRIVAVGAPAEETRT